MLLTVFFLFFLHGLLPIFRPIYQKFAMGPRINGHRQLWVSFCNRICRAPFCICSNNIRQLIFPLWMPEVDPWEWRGRLCLPGAYCFTSWAFAVFVSWQWGPYSVCGFELLSWYLSVSALRGNIVVWQQNGPFIRLCLPVCAHLFCKF